MDRLRPALAAAEDRVKTAEREVGPAQHCSPRHRMPCNSRNQSSECVPMTWQAVFDGPWRSAGCAAAGAAKEHAALSADLSAARALRAALEPRVEQLGAELAEARAEAKVRQCDLKSVSSARDSIAETNIS